jgi:hypothetical protein
VNDRERLWKLLDACERAIASLNEGTPDPDTVLLSDLRAYRNELIAQLRKERFRAKPSY